MLKIENFLPYNHIKKKKCHKHLKNKIELIQVGEV